jgi:hypothetical protein
MCCVGTGGLVMVSISLVFEIFPSSSKVIEMSVSMLCTLVFFNLGGVGLMYIHTAAKTTEYSKNRRPNHLLKATPMYRQVTIYTNTRRFFTFFAELFCKSPQHRWKFSVASFFHLVLRGLFGFWSLLFQFFL